MWKKKEKCTNWGKIRKSQKKLNQKLKRLLNSQHEIHLDQLIKKTSILILKALKSVINQMLVIWTQNL